MPKRLSQAEFSAVTRSFWSRQMTAVVMPSRTASGRVRRRVEVSMCCGSQEAGHKVRLKASAKSNNKHQNGASLFPRWGLNFDVDRRCACEFDATAVQKDGNQLMSACTNSVQGGLD